eukprot:CAMPEP_0180554722 /NCGR_PEP_ID=MMETSP1036_2-20121128/75060_1 /TAXON_ID=632150 /ORGANISM="Azadinium spinosum, Strain 3D9" /LENGTH=418 /DNA_ID=CAMNT_0022570521 /DNA_START=21 /DNA_END=1274 /DNA_ORIENTATION=+
MTMSSSTRSIHASMVGPGSPLSRSVSMNGKTDSPVRNGIAPGPPVSSSIVSASPGSSCDVEVSRLQMLEQEVLSLRAQNAQVNGELDKIRGRQQLVESNVTAIAAAMTGTDATVKHDTLIESASAIFDDATMRLCLPASVHSNFKQALITGAKTSERDMEAIAEAIFGWARGLGAVSFAHWFFPMRGGGGCPGGANGAFKMDTLIDLEWSSTEATKPFKATLPSERLFFGETDGSSFPNGGLRATHTAAAFTTWDRSSPCFVLDNVLRIPCCFVTHLGACIDEKTPLLRSNDALNREGLRLLRNINIDAKAKAIYSYLGWEQEFFVVTAEHYRARPDLVNCGRTLVGSLPTRSQQADLNYFAPVPASVSTLLFKIQEIMLKLGVPMAVIHNEVAPAQHEMSPIYCQATFASDNNVLFM